MLFIPFSEEAAREGIKRAILTRILDFIDIFKNYISITMISHAFPSRKEGR